jgi:hypothetical protein
MKKFTSRQSPLLQRKSLVPIEQKNHELHTAPITSAAAKNRKGLKAETCIFTFLVHTP